MSDPSPGRPGVEWIEGDYLARWTFDTDDRAEQARQFHYWKGWFGYGENDEPERMDGNVWIARSSMNAPAK